MTQSELEALLGRPLTQIEIDNLSLYLEIAEDALEDLICTPLASVNETREFDTRKGYSTAFVDIFTSIDEVKVNGTATTSYEVRQWDKRNASWYNSLVMDNKFLAEDVIQVTAEWGLSSSGIGSDLPVDLQVLLAGLFDQITKKNKADATISSKKVEDFSISFNADVDLDQAFADKYGKIIAKYSLCDIPNVQSGRVCEC